MSFLARFHLGHAFATATAVISGGAVAFDAIHQAALHVAPLLGPKVTGATVALGAISGLLARLDKVFAKKPEAPKP